MTEYIEKVKNELKSIKRNLLKIDSWKKEIEVIENKINSYISFNSDDKIIDLESIIENDQARLEILKTNIYYTEYKIEKMKAYIDHLEYEEKKVIELKYLDKDINSISFRVIGDILNCSKDTVKRLHDNAINKITKYRYETNVRQNQDKLETHQRQQTC